MFLVFTFGESKLLTPVQRLSLTLERRYRIGRPVSSECSLILHTSKHHNKLRKTWEKGTVIIADRKAPVTQEQKKTDHIDEELRLEIFKTSAIIFSCYFRIFEQGSKRHREKFQSQFCWSISDFFRALPARF